MNRKYMVILFMFVALIGIVTFEQIYTDSAINSMLSDVKILNQSIENKDLEEALTITTKINKDWEMQESIICLFVDFREIENIGKQVDLVMSHLNNRDFELATVEANTLKRVLLTFKNMTGFNLDNII